MGNELSGPSSVELQGLSPATTYGILNTGVLNSPDRALILASLRNRDDAALRARVEANPSAWALVGDVIRRSNEYGTQGTGVITTDRQVVAQGDAVAGYLQYINDPMTKLQNKSMTLLTDYCPWLAGAGVIAVLVWRRK